ncbi:MAG: prenyltransferase/squalene oxidase repeat-containing protein [Nanoarchaeota archaeon]
MASGKRYFIFLLFVFFIFLPACQSEEETINKAISDGITFLHENQMDSGEFATCAFIGDALDNCYYDGSPFITSFILYSIKDISHPHIASINQKGIQFLLSEQLPGGLWSYWTKSNKLEIIPDIDDTSAISHILAFHDIPFEDNKELIKNNLDEQGRYQTWITKETSLHDTDCVINANVLLYLQEENLAACAFINEEIQNQFDCSYYYTNVQSFYYMVARAYANGVICLEPTKATILQNLKQMQSGDGSIGSELNTALAANVFLDFNESGPDLDQAISFLLNSQRKDGSWPRDTIYKGPSGCEHCIYWGADELTTAFAIEALHKYRSRYPRNV